MAGAFGQVVGSPLAEGRPRRRGGEGDVEKTPCVQGTGKQARHTAGEAKAGPGGVQPAGGEATRAET